MAWSPRRGGTNVPFIDPDAELAQLLKTFHSFGGVVSHYLVSDVGAEGHPRVARAAAIRWVREAFASDATLPSTHEADMPLVGREISLAEFFGPRFDLSRRVVRFPTSGGLLPAKEAMAARVRSPSYGSDAFGGYAHAFSDPPYTLRSRDAGLKPVLLDEVDRVFTATWEALVGTWDEDAMSIFEWNTDAWPEFASGREWWGSYLWTIRRRDASRFVAIVASCTD